MLFQKINVNIMYKLKLAVQPIVVQLKKIYAQHLRLCIHNARQCNLLCLLPGHFGYSETNRKCRHHLVMLKLPKNQGQMQTENVSL
jgi:hypothetical protein